MVVGRIYRWESQKRYTGELQSGRRSVTPGESKEVYWGGITIRFVKCTLGQVKRGERG